MKKISYFVAQLAIVAVASTMFACGGNEAEKKTENKQPKTSTVASAGKNDKTKTPGDTISAPADGQINVRYIDEEKLLQEYSLAKDFQESITRLQSKLISAQESRAKDIQTLGSQIESKMKNNGYSSESEYNSDMARFNKKQQDAQTYLANLQRSTEAEVAQLQTQLQDSIRNYVKQFSLDNGYDAVMMKSVSFYFNPAFDVTDQVLEGLNARYNKVQK